MTHAAVDRGSDPTGVSEDIDLVKLYGDICAGIRDTDEVSFRLLGLVPLVSGGSAGALAYLLTNEALGPLPIALLTLLGAVTTFGVFRWELRNIQTCNRLWDRAEFLEKRLGFGDLAGREPAPQLLGHAIGKAHSEKIIYGASVGA